MSTYAAILVPSPDLLISLIYIYIQKSVQIIRVQLNKVSQKEHFYVTSTQIKKLNITNSSDTPHAPTIHTPVPQDNHYFYF